MQRITVPSSIPQHIEIRNARTVVIGSEPYEGMYSVTPSTVSQVLSTKGKSMSENVVIEPIPQNYGLITYNGFELTVS